MVSKEQREAAAKASIPKDAKTSKQKSEERIAANKTRGGYVSQKEKALASGGRYAEGGEVYQVGKAGRNISITLNESLRFSDSIQATKVEGRDSTSFKARQVEKVQTSSSRSSYDSYGEASAPPLTRGEKRRAQERYGQQPFNIIEASKKAYESSSKFIYGLGESGLEIVSGGISEELKYGPTNIFTSKGIVESEQTKEAEKKIDFFTPKDTVTQKAVEGRFSEIDLTDPRQAGQAFIYPAMAGSIGAAAGVKGISKAAAVYVEKKGVRDFNKFLTGIGEPKGVQRIDDTKVIETSKTLIPKEGGEPITAFVKRTTVKNPVTGRGTYITTGGTETNPSPAEISVLKFGKRQVGFEKEPATVRPIRPTGEELPATSPQEINIQGRVGKVAREGMGVTQTGPFRYTTAKPPGQFGKKVYNIGMIKKQGVEIARSHTIPLKNVLKEDASKFVTGSRRFQSVYTQTRAEKPIIEQARSTGSPMTPFSKLAPETGRGGAGSAGRSQVFRPEQARAIRQTEISKVTQEEKNRENLEILFQKPRFTEGGPALVTGELYQPTKTTYPKTSEQTGRLGFMAAIQTNVKPGVIPSERQGLGFIARVDIKKGTGSTTKQAVTLGFSDRIDTDLITGSKTTTTPDEGFKIREDFVTRLQTGTPGPPPPNPPPPPPELPPPPEPIIKPKIFGLLPGPRSSRDYDAPSRPLKGTLGWKGNVPEFAIGGIYGKRSEITYSEGKIRGVKAGKRIKTTKSMLSIGKRNPINISGKNSRTTISSKGKGKRIKLF